MNGKFVYFSVSTYFPNIKLNDCRYNLLDQLPVKYYGNLFCLYEDVLTEKSIVFAYYLKVKSICNKHIRQNMYFKSVIH